MARSFPKKQHKETKVTKTVKKPLPETLTQFQDDTDVPGSNDTGLGARIREAREKRRLTQAAVAKHVGLGRTATTQWELGRSSPSLETVNQLAVLFDEDPAWIAYGVRQGPKLIQPNMEDIGCQLVEEVTFGESPTETKMVENWALPTRWLRSEIGVSDPTKVILYRVEWAFRDSRYEHGDVLIIDRMSTRPSPPGTFLFWDGVGPALADITVTPVPMKNKVVAKVTTMDGATFETEVDNLAIIGRVRGTWRKS
jgi:transcriptional regulator with XRE-family HTH domain